MVLYKQGRSNEVLLVGPATDLSLDMNDNKMLYVVSICAAVSLALVLKWQRRGSRSPYPPGPRTYPLVGSVLGIPRDVPIWKAFVSIAEKFSKCSIPAGGFCAKDAAATRHRCVIPEVILSRLCHPEQLRSHLRSCREAVRNLL